MIVNLNYLKEYLSYEADKGMKSILNFQTFQKIRKRAWGTQFSDNPKRENAVFLNFGGCGGNTRQALFFEKFENFRILFIPLSASYDKYSLR